MKIGILALQGAVQPHQAKLAELGVEAVLVKTPEQLVSVAGIILPGGESTTMIKLLKLNHLWEPLREFVTTNPCWGICAGAILLAKRVRNPEQASLEALDVAVERNAYGRQLDSFITTDLEYHEPILMNQEAVFIRAPRFIEIGSNVCTLVSYKGEAVCLKQDRILASSFHPELSPGTILHQYFISEVQKSL